jgi:hypothetical protein
MRAPLRRRQSPTSTRNMAAGFNPIVRRCRLFDNQPKSSHR